MLINRIYRSILDRNAFWNYYNANLKAPNIEDIEDCYRFITDFIKYSPLEYIPFSFIFAYDCCVESPEKTISSFCADIVLTPMLFMNALFPVKLSAFIVL